MHIAWLLRKWIRGVSFQINCSTASVGLSQENLILWHKLRCYIGISGPRKSCNSTREKISYFFTCVDIANQLLTRHSPLAPLGQGDEWMAKLSQFSIQKKSVSLTDSEVQTFLEGKKKPIYKRKTESYVFSGFGVSISLGWEWKSTTGRFATGRFLPFTWKTSSVDKDKVNKWEFCKLKITTIVVFIIMSQRIFHLKRWH